MELFLILAAYFGLLHKLGVLDLVQFYDNIKKIIKE